MGKVESQHIANVIDESMLLCQEDDSIGALSRPCLLLWSLFISEMKNVMVISCQ